METSEKFSQTEAEKRLAEGRDFLTEAGEKYNGKNYTAYFAQVYSTLVQQPGYNHEKALKETWQLAGIQVIVKKISAYGVSKGFGGARVNHPTFLKLQELFKELCNEMSEELKQLKEETGYVPAFYPKIVNKDKNKEWKAARKS